MVKQFFKDKKRFILIYEKLPLKFYIKASLNIERTLNDTSENVSLRTERFHYGMFNEHFHVQNN